MMSTSIRLSPSGPIPDLPANACAARSSLYARFTETIKQTLAPKTEDMRAREACRLPGRVQVERACATKQRRAEMAGGRRSHWL
eukprot:SAG11_NODE_2409_length_3396_cov_1.523506_5_plen_84_part_00